MNLETVKISQKQLIERCRKQDPLAQREVYDLYQRAMFNTAIRICGNESDAEDALQEGFVNAFKHMDKYRGESTFGALLKRIIINKSLSTLKKSKQFSEVLTSLNEKDHFEYQWEDLADPTLTVEAIKGAIKGLSDGFRMVLTLYLFEGYDHSEIAEILGISESTSKSQYSRAKEKIRKKLETRKNHE